MHRGTVLRTALALMLMLGVSVVTIGTPATAATTGRYRTQPMRTVPAPVNLGLSVTVKAGTTHLVSSYLVVGGASTLTLVSHLVYCRLAGSATVTERIVTGQNVLRATKVTLLTRALVTAPATGDLTCRLYAIFFRLTTGRVGGTINVLSGTSLMQSGTSLNRLATPIQSSAQTWQDGRVLVNTSYRAAPVRFTPVEGTDSIQAFGDVNVTVCYDGGKDRGSCLGAGSRRSALFASVGTQLVVQQLQADGTVCRTMVNGPLVATRISNTIHHWKFNKSVSNIAVSSTCTSPEFRAYLRVTTSRIANSIVVEENHQSETALYVRP
jgi:hypothetical protein